MAYVRIEEWPTERLEAEDVPGPPATWSEITWFAAHLDGYRVFGQARLGAMANASVDFWRENKRVDDSLDLAELRGCLFFEYRRYHHFGHAPSTAETPYLRALMTAILDRVTYRASG
jgi:hypothetical protein